MDLTKRVERLEALLTEQQDKSLAAEIVAHLFYARLLNVSEAIGDPMDLNKTLERLDEDMTAAISEAATPRTRGPVASGRGPSHRPRRGDPRHAPGLSPGQRPDLGGLGGGLRREAHRARPARRR